MTEALANLTQVINLSPQVGALAGGYLAAVEAARQAAQVDTSQRLRELLARTVLALEEGGEVGAPDSEGRRSFKGRLPASRPRPAAPLRRQAGNEPGTEVARGPFEPVPVIDLRL